MKKRLVSIILAAAMLTMTGCSIGETVEATTAAATEAEAGSTEESSSTYKIGIMTTTVSSGEECYRTAQEIKEKYGDKIVIQTYPDKLAGTETTISNAMMLASDPDVKAIVFCQANQGTIAAIEKIQSERPDILTVAAGPQEEVAAVGQIADVVYVKGGAQHGVQIAQAAYDMGAKTLFHYSFPRSMSMQVTVEKHDAMKAKAEELGMEFVDVTTPDPQGDSGVSGCQQFVLEDVKRKIEEYGTDSAFYGSTMQMNEPMIKTVAENGAIFTMPADPSPFMGFPAALGIEVPEDKEGDTDYMIEQISAKLDEMGMSGRMGCWNFALFPVFMNAGVDYCIEYLEGNTDGKCDAAVLQEKLEEYAKSSVEMTAYSDEQGTELDNTYYFVGSVIFM